jgi:hypothetical protein
MQLGKFSCDRDSALHYLCSGEWSNDSFGDVTDYGRYVWRISNTWEEVKPAAMDFTSVLAEWLEANPEVQDSEEFRRELVGHFLVTELDNGQVIVLKCADEGQLEHQFAYMQAQYEAWADSSTDDDTEQGEL